MREIKFRAWETKEKRMLHNGQFHIYLSSISNYGISHHFHDEEERQYKFVTCKRNNWDSSKTEVILMQFTGLVDKSGVEIYEGDIIKTGVFGELKSKVTRKSVVEWNERLGQWCVKFPYGFMDIGSTSLDMTPFGLWQYECEVVGNIYENKELIK